LISEPTQPEPACKRYNINYFGRPDPEGGESSMSVGKSHGTSERATTSRGVPALELKQRDAIPDPMPQLPGDAQASRVVPEVVLGAPLSNGTPAESAATDTLAMVHRARRMERRNTS